MLGSQILNIAQTFSGRDFGANELEALGYCIFERAISTADSWAAHAGVEIIVLLQGEACWDCGSDLMLQASGGQVVFFPAGLRHRISDGTYSRCQTLWFVFNPPGAMQGNRLFGREEENQFVAAMPDGPVIRSMSPQFLSTARDFARSLQDPGAISGSRLVMSEIRSKLFTLLVEFWRTCEQIALRQSQSQIVRQAVGILKERAAESVSINDIAAQLGCSRGYLHSLFRTEVGMSPSDFHRRMRLRICCNRLRDPSRSITDISYELGFSSSQHLSKVFKDYFGVSPTVYRTRHAELALGET